MKHPPKHDRLMERIQAAVATGQYLDTAHARQRTLERRLTRLDVEHVLAYGRHEAGKDRFIPAFSAWNYAIRGKTLEGKPVRVIVSFEDEFLIVVTAIVVR